MAETPTLTTEEQLRVRNGMQAVEIAQLRLELARREFHAMLQPLHREGYLLNLDTMAYQPAIEAASEDASR